MDNISFELKKFENEINEKHKRFIGYPINLAFQIGEVFSMFDFSIYLNNIGDPYGQNNSQKKFYFELKVLEYFTNLFDLKAEDSWGYVTSGSTEGNLCALRIARNKYPDGILYFSEDAHYSITKSAKMFKIPSIPIPTTNNGEINYEILENKLSFFKGSRPPIICLNIGSTMKGAIDNINIVLEILKTNCIHNFYIHCDAALLGMVIPFTEVKENLSFSLPIDSIVISGHKFIGIPMPCGIIISKKDNCKYQNDTMVQYINNFDSTILGSRNGHTAILLYYAILKRAKNGFEYETKMCLENTEYLSECMNELGYSAFFNKNSNIVYFELLNEFITKKWNLAIQNNLSHIVVMQHVTKDVINSFINDLKVCKTV